MRWIAQVRVAAQLSMLILVLVFGVLNATAQEHQQSNEVVQLEEIVAAQQKELEQLDARLAKLEEAYRILGFDQHVEAAKMAKKSRPVRPSEKPVSAETELDVGSSVLVEWKNRWWNGSVLEELPNGGVRIHYEGWDAKYDEVVPRSRLQLPTHEVGLAQQNMDTSLASHDMSKAGAEVRKHYAAAHPEIQEYILWTANSFGRNEMWLNEDAFASLTEEESQQLVRDLAALLEDGEYGRHLCPGLARASALRDERLVPGLMKVAGYHREEGDYDCRPKWMAVAALARQESDAAVPLLISLVDHGNQNTRKWARAALSRKTGQDFKEEKRAWAEWWQAQGHESIDDELLRPWKAPPESGS